MAWQGDFEDRADAGGVERMRRLERARNARAHGRATDARDALDREYTRREQRKAKAQRVGAA